MKKMNEELVEVNEQSNNQEDILDLMRNLKYDLETDFYNKGLDTKIDDIEYLGKMNVEVEKDGQITVVQKDAFLVAQRDGEDITLKYYLDREPIAIESRLGIALLGEGKEYLLPKLNDAKSESKEDNSLNLLEDKRLKQLQEITGLEEDEIRAYAEINTDQVIKPEKVLLESMNIKTEIDPNDRVTDKTFAEIFPETKEKNFKKVIPVASKKNSKSDGMFHFVGVTPEGNCEPFESLKPTEGTNPNKEISSINRDGSEVTQEQVSAIVMKENDKNEGLSVRIGAMGTIEVDYIRRTPNNEYIKAPVETNRQRYTTTEVRQFMDKNRNIDMQDEIDRTNDEIKAHGDFDGEINMKNIDDDPNNDVGHDDVIVLDDGTETTFEEEAAKAKVSEEEFRKKYESQSKNLTPQQRLENVHEEIEEEFIGPRPLDK